MEDFNKLLLQELSEIKDDIKAIRVKDIPNIKVEMAILKREASLSSKLHALVGGLVAVFVSHWTK